MIVAQTYLPARRLLTFQRFVEEGDRAIGLDLANEMDATSGNWQGIGQMRDLFGSQTMKCFATPAC